MRVLITGGTGIVGKSTTERFIEKGWDVRVIGIEPDVQIDGAEYFQCDILNFEDVLKHTQGCDSVVHLAAIRSPNLAPAQDVFQINAAGTFNVFEAAAVTGIKRVVQASSINAIGCAYNLIDFKARYFPIDEDHPILTTDPYSFSKQIIEDIGTYYWRREGISSVAMRFPGVYKNSMITSERFVQQRANARNLIDELASQPESVREARLADVRKRTLEYRASRPLEYYPDAPPFWTSPLLTEDALFRAYAMDRFNLWVNIDERDAAQSLEKGVTADYEGSHPLFINDYCNWLITDTQTLIRLFYPDVTELRGDVSGSKAMVSIEKARKLIGFEPEYSIEKLGQS